ncbi:MAG: hypothetical protein AAF850_11675 [Pseudomonadota bacterium]
MKKMLMLVGAGSVSAALIAWQAAASAVGGDPISASIYFLDLIGADEVLAFFSFTQLGLLGAKNVGKCQCDDEKKAGAKEQKKT